MADRERVLVILESADTGVPLAVSVKRVLKALGRVHHVRAVWLEDASDWEFGDRLVKQEEAACASE